MLLFKLILGVSVILLFLKIAKNKNESKKQVYELYYHLYILCEDFYNEMLYKKTPINDFLKKRNGNKLFNNIIDSYINNKLDKSLFNKDFTDSEIDAILTFFSSLYDANTESVKNTLLSYKNQFYKWYIERNEKAKKYAVLYTKIGFSVGLMIMIVVL